MAYTPELTQKNSCTLRRLAWSLNRPMTKAMDFVFTDLVRLIPTGAVCESCKDQTQCASCPFSKGGKPSGRP